MIKRWKAACDAYWRHSTEVSNSYSKSYFPQSHCYPLLSATFAYGASRL